MTQQPLPEEARDFDFFIGEWNVSHRRLKTRLAGDDTWAEFGGTVSVRKILGGLGNVDDNVIDLPEGRYRAVTVRFFTPSTGRWSIHWIDGRDPKLDTPLVGTFRNEVGTFFCDETFEGRPIKIRFLWTKLGADACRWAQAFSADGGASWETNWVMDFSRMTTVEAKALAASS